MIKNYLKIAWRSLLKYKTFSSINIFGLATGMACSLLILLFVKDELSYDRYHKDADRVYRVVKDFINDDGSHIPDATSIAGLAPAMQRDIPEVEAVTRIRPDWGGTWLVEYGDRKLSEQKYWRVDSNFFDIFTYTFIKGSPETALSDVTSVVITESIAKKYFGDEDPMGKTLKISCCGGSLKVTAVIKDVPANSHFHFNMLSSFRQLGNLDDNWQQYNFYTYARVKPNTSITSFTKKIQETFNRNEDDKSVFYVQPLTGIHLTSNLKWELEPNGDRLYVYVFGIVGLFILLIAAINYINLSTAKSSLRTKEVGVRKVSGALRSSLIKQFLFESLVTCFISSVLAIIIAQLLLPIVNNITLKHISVIDNPLTVTFMILAALFVGLIAGLFPALYLSSFKPILVLKGLKLKEGGALTLRKALVVVQFTISSVLIIGALIIYQQMKFIQNAKLGIDKEQVIVLKNVGSMSLPDRNAYLNTIKRIPDIKGAAIGNFSMGEGFSTTRLSVKGSENGMQLNFANVGYGYTDVVGIQMKEGRGFSDKFPGDTLINNGIPNGPLEQNIGGIIINETAAKEFGLGSPAINKQFLWGNNGDTSYYVSVVGVMRDFNFTSLRNEIKPFGLICRPRNGNNITVKLSAQNIQSALVQLESQWKNFNAAMGFDYVFLDDTFSKLYASEARFQKLFVSLVILGILIACLGLLGLATFSAQQRVKEIGVRKVLGASVLHVVGLLSKDFLKLVLIAFLLATPIAWYIMSEWLKDFAYRMDIQWWIFLVAAVIAIIIAFVTISTQAIKAAIANPVKSLRTE